MSIFYAIKVCILKYLNNFTRILMISLLFYVHIPKGFKADLNHKKIILIPVLKFPIDQNLWLNHDVGLDIVSVFLTKWHNQSTRPHDHIVH